ncbi:hypothetical protein [Paracoccus aestuariivivens]|uniref:Peptidoglycan-binding protein n=1 Tax=Paracoccus aestuariivivens TaxID=1820333 RepID=A0A6L6J9L1_9RHOB|nr:hypothetical protein [Paracoccus aestuariivivens]MTH77429.1 hypothetical protein [Paracoccus aestuariivivens]
MTIRKTLLSVSTGLLLAGQIASPAHAIGETEKDVLKGLAAAAAIGMITGQVGSGAAPQATTAAPLPASASATKMDMIETAFRSLSREERLAVQNNLIASGAGLYSADGVWGRKTATAMNRVITDTGEWGLIRDQRSANKYVYDMAQFAYGAE